MKICIYVSIILSFFGSQIGNAQQNWSDPGTWPSGTVPKAGENVIVPEGATIVLDTDTPSLGSLTIDGTLTFDDKDVSLFARWIMVHGLLQIGTEQQPFQNKATITLTGPEEDVNTMGGRFLVTMNRGSLQLHGASANKLSWGQLNGTLAAGSTQLTLDKDPSGWQVGDKIAIAPSGYNPFETEEVTITAVSGRTVSFSPALQYAHYGELQEYGGKVLDERAEVGLLTRNIRIQGAADSEELNFGGHIMVMFDSGPVNIEGVELTHLGQPGIAARYSFHWHLAGDREGDYFRHSSIHHALQRAVVVHQTDNVLVENVVAYNIKNHAFIPAEDGNEIDNTFKNNLAMLVRRPDDGFFAFPRDGGGGSGQGEHRVAGFWMRNVHNNLIGNHSAGSERGTGFFFDQGGRELAFRELDLLARDIVFENNVAHTCSVPGDNNNGVTNVATYTRVGHGHGLFIDNFDNGDLMWTFSNFTSYKNAMSGVWSEMLNVTLDNHMVADNSIAFLSSESHVQNSVVVGVSDNTIGGPNRILRDGHKRAGYYSIAEGGRKLPKFQNVDFININSGLQNGDVAAAVVGNRENDGVNYFEDVRLTNTQPVYMRTIGRGVGDPVGSFILDRDGSLTGYGKPAIVVHEYSPLIDETAIYHEDWRAYVLDAENMLHLDFFGIPFELEINMVRDDGTFIMSRRFLKDFFFGIKGNTGYTFHGDWSVDENGQTIQMRSALQRQGDWAIIRYPYPYDQIKIINDAETEIMRVASEAQLSGVNGNAYFFDKENDQVILKMVTEEDGQTTVTLLAEEGIDVGDGFLPAESFEDVINVMVTPNPVTSTSTLNYTLLKEQFVGISLFDMSGRQVQVIATEEQDPGNYSLPLDNLRLQSGLYVISFKLADQDMAVKVVVP